MRALLLGAAALVAVASAHWATEHTSPIGDHAHGPCKHPKARHQREPDSSAAASLSGENDPETLVQGLDAEDHKLAQKVLAHLNKKGHGHGHHYHHGHKKPCACKKPPVPQAQFPIYGSTSALIALKEKKGVDTFTNALFAQGRVKHIVLYTLNDQATPAIAKEIERRAHQLKTSSVRGTPPATPTPLLTSVDSGYQNGGSGTNAGYQYIIEFELNSLGNRNYFVGAPVVTEEGYFDPSYAAFKVYLANYTSATLEFDYSPDH